MDKIRVVLAEDHSIVRQGTRNLLEREPDIAVVAEASNGREAVQAVQETMPDVVVLDVAMPEMTGIEATRIIKHLHPRAVGQSDRTHAIARTTHYLMLALLAIMLLSGPLLALMLAGQPNIASLTHAAHGFTANLLAILVLLVPAPAGSTEFSA